MGGVVSTITRAVAATATGGASELVRKKPFQPGGGGGDLTAAALGPGGSAALLGAKEGMKAASPKPPDVPEATAPPSTQTQAVQEAVGEAFRNRRSRARGYRSTLLSQMLPSSMRETYGG